jgi:ferredoxin
MTASSRSPGRREPAPGELTIDWSRCDGHGLCAALLPAAVTLDEWGFPLLDRTQLAGLHPSELNRAISVCPALALRLVAT